MYWPRSRNQRLKAMNAKSDHRTLNKPNKINVHRGTLSAMKSHHLNDRDARIPIARKIMKKKKVRSVGLPVSNVAAADPV